MKILNFIKNLFKSSKKEEIIEQKPEQTGKELRDLGIQQSIDNANTKIENWSEIAYNFLLDYVKNHPEFMIEDLRNASIGSVPVPPSNRAWGGVAVKAVKAGIIERKDFRNVKNPKAHYTPATLWKVL